MSPMSCVIDDLRQIFKVSWMAMLWKVPSVEEVQSLDKLKNKLSLFPEKCDDQDVQKLIELVTVAFCRDDRRYQAQRAFSLALTTRTDLAMHAVLMTGDILQKNARADIYLACHEMLRAIVVAVPCTSEAVLQTTRANYRDFNLIINHRADVETIGCIIRARVMNTATPKRRASYAPG